MFSLMYFIMIFITNALRMCIKRKYNQGNRSILFQTLLLRLS